MRADLDKESTMRVIAIDPITDKTVNGVTDTGASHLYVGAGNGGVETLLTETAFRAYNKHRELVAGGTPKNDPELLAQYEIMAGGTFAFADLDAHPALRGYVVGTIEDMYAWTTDIELVVMEDVCNTVPFSNAGNDGPRVDMPLFARTFTEVAEIFGFQLHR